MSTDFGSNSRRSVAADRASHHLDEAACSKAVTTSHWCAVFRLPDGRRCYSGSCFAILHINVCVAFELSTTVPWRLAVQV
eukprot:scaffold932_cov328-Pavlova_lutheri.AAC.4